MNLYTLFYTNYVGDGHYVANLVRVWADDEASAVTRCSEEFGDVFAVVAGHPEILSHRAEHIKTLNWGS